MNHNRINELGEVIRIMKRVENRLDAKQVLSVIERYNTALELLDEYDHQTMKMPEGNQALFPNGKKRIDDYALAALTIMIAESKPEEKDMTVKVVMNCLIGSAE